MIEEIASRENLERAFNHFVKGKSSRKIVRRVIERKEYYISEAQRQLLTGAYRCAPPITMKRIERGKERFITYTEDPIDILIRHAVSVYLSDIIVPKMHRGVSANIVGRGSTYCMKIVKGYVQEGHSCYLLEDVRKYFGNIDVHILLSLIEFYASPDEATMTVIKEMLSLCESGIALGTMDCQLWANVMLMPVDNAIATQFPELRYARYCDNLYLIGDDVMVLHKAHQLIQGVMRRLHLKLNPCLFGATKDGLRVLSIVCFPTHTRITRRIREAVRKSDELPAYFGILKLADSKHFIRSVIYKKFSDLVDIPEYISRFTGDKRELPSLVGKRLILTDCEIEKSKFSERDGTARDRAKVAFRFGEDDDREYVFFSSSKPILHYCRQFMRNPALYFPLEVVITRVNKQYNFTNYAE